MENDIYVFKKDEKDVVAELGRRVKDWTLFAGGLGGGKMHSRWKAAYRAYYGQYNGGIGLVSAGESEQLTEMYVNHLRNLILHIYNMTTQNRLVFDSLAQNSDVKSRNDAIVSNSVCDYYFYDKQFEKATKQVAEMGLVFGTAFLYVGWDTHKSIFGVDGLGKPVYRGEPTMRALSPFDVILENPLKDDFKDQNWVVVREVALKHDLAVVYSKKKKEILNLPRIKEFDGFMNNTWQRHDDNVAIYKFFHKPCPSLPLGRYTVFTENGDVLLDRLDNPYAGIPVIPFIPDKMFGGAYGHSRVLALLPAQEAHNAVMSTIISNQRAFGTQNIVVFKESNINPSELNGNLNVLEVSHIEDLPGGGVPQALQLCSTPSELFNFEKSLVASMEQDSGVNAATRGNPPASATSGTAIALISASATAFNGVVESAYISMCEEAACNLIELLKKYMKYEELIAISGSSNTYAVQSFKGEDLLGIRRVRILTGNALSKTLSGRVSIADTLLASQMITAQEYMEVLQTGSLAKKIEDTTIEESFIKHKTELLAQGIKVPALMYDNHPRMIAAIKLLTMRPDIRLNSNVLALVLESMEEHINMLQTLISQAGVSQVDASKLAIALNQPIQVAPPPPSQGQMQGGQQGGTGAAMSGEVKPDQNSSDPASAAASGEQRAQKEQQQADAQMAQQ